MRRRYHFVLLNDIVTTTNPLLPLRPTPPPEGSFSPSLSLALHPSRRREKDGDGELRGGAQRREAPQRRHPRPERHRLRRLRAHRRRPPGLQRLRQPRLHLPPRLPPLPLPPRSPLLPQDDAVAVNQHPFKRSTAFLVGNEGTGLSAKECKICDFFVYIPQYGSGTASLNVTVAASIVLHHFAVWAGFSERIRDGNKFVVAEKPAKQVKRNFCAETVDAIIEERKSRKQNASEFFDGDGNAQSSSNLLEGLFSDDQ